MKIVCIIAEYNPLHNGHVYHLGESRPLGDATMVLMGGDFCQRGSSAVLDKYTRAEHAVSAGADIVVELPALCTVNCAEQFALGAMRMMDPLPNSALSFGSECGDVKQIEDTASALASDEVNDETKRLVGEGTAFPTARKMALDDYAARHKICPIDITQPNNILGLEYVKAAGNRHPLYTVKRTAEYHSAEPALSSGYVRTAMQTGADYTDIVPPYVAADLARATPEQSVLYLAALRAHDKGYYEGLLDATEGLQNRVWQCANECNTLEDAVAKAQTKRYTRARISRLFTAALLDLRQNDLEALRTARPYYNVLAVKSSHTHLLSYLSQYGDLITSQRELQEHPLGKIDARAHEIYRLLHATDVPQSMRVVEI